MNRKSKILGWSLLLFIVYCTLAAVVFFAGLLALQKGVLLDVPWVAAAQKSMYRRGMVGANSWLSQPGCIVPDPDLIYIPGLGTCTFDDIEFKTKLTFTAEGRNTGPRPEGTGIAVIGDSHAMGWGVNDLDTFSAQLQKLSGRPVYNLAVASYGTAREVIRLERSGLLDKVDTVIIQYCNNDRNENLEFDSASRQALTAKVFGQNVTPVAPQPNKLAYIAKGYGLTLAAPFRILSERLRRKNFTPHYEPFISALRRHEAALKGKQVIVFYSNAYGQKYRNFPQGPDAHMPNVHFVDLDLDTGLYRQLDNHLKPAGHLVVAESLLDKLNTFQASP
jgi:hypothetical protein